MWDAAKIVFIDKFMVLNACLRQEKRYEISNPAFYLKKLVV